MGFFKVSSLIRMHLGLHSSLRVRLGRTTAHPNYQKGVRASHKSPLLKYELPQEGGEPDVHEDFSWLQDGQPEAHRIHGGGLVLWLSLNFHGQI